MKTVALIDLNHVSSKTLLDFIPVALRQNCEVHLFGNKKSMQDFDTDMLDPNTGIHVHGGDKNLPHYSTTLAKPVVEKLLVESPCRVYVLSALPTWDVFCDKLVACKSVVVRGSDKQGALCLKGWKPEILVNHKQVYMSVTTAKLPPTSYVAHARKNLFAGMSLAIYTTIRAHLNQLVTA